MENLKNFRNFAGLRLLRVKVNAKILRVEMLRNNNVVARKRGFSAGLSRGWGAG